MSELAYNMNGEPFEVPATATGWRVRRMRQKGAPEVVYGRDGLPLVLPVDASVDDLRDAVGVSGRYRVDPVEDHRVIPNAPAGYVFVHDGDAPVTLSRVSLPSPTDSAVIEAMRMNAEIAKSVIEQFPPMMHAAAQLLRAADGAGLPAKLPLLLPADGDDDDGADERPKSLDIEALVGQLVPVLISALQGRGQLDLSSLVDWRRAGRSAVCAQTQTPPVPAKSKGTGLTLEPGVMAHLLAVQAALAPDEVAFVREVAKELGPDELHRWLDELRKLSVPDAVQRVRELIAGNAKKGGAA
jgi:hypothetical protein